MSNTFLYIAWAFLYAACAGLGFIASPEGAAKGLMIFFGLVFFLPPAILLCRASRAGDKKTLRRFCVLSLCWLVVAMLMIIANILSVAYDETTGLVLYYVMVVLTAPMVCCQHWVLAMFCWACLLVVSWQQLRKK